VTNKGEALRGFVQWLVNRFGKSTPNLDRDIPASYDTLDLRPGRESALASASM
jgi:hypothetical protein